MAIRTARIENLARPVTNKPPGSTLAVDDFLDFESLKEAAPRPQFTPGALAVAEPPPDPAAFRSPAPSGAQKLVPGARQRYLARFEEGRQQYDAAVQPG